MSSAPSSSRTAAAAAAAAATTAGAQDMYCFNQRCYGMAVQACAGECCCSSPSATTRNVVLVGGLSQAACLNMTGSCCCWSGVAGNGAYSPSTCRTFNPQLMPAPRASSLMLSVVTSRTQAGLETPTPLMQSPSDIMNCMHSHPCSVSHGAHCHTTCHPRFVDLRTTSGFSALHYASYWGNGQVVGALLTAGADVTWPTANTSTAAPCELVACAGSTSTCTWQQGRPRICHHHDAAGACERLEGGWG